MIHYLLLLRPVTFQHEPPPPPPSSLYHYPHYYQQQDPKVNPTKPQKPHHQQQRKQETQYSRLIVEQPSSSQSHVKTRALSYGTLQKCNCLNSVSAASTRANKQAAAAAGSSLSSYSTRKNQSNQWKHSTISDKKEHQPQHLTSNTIVCKKGNESHSLHTSNRTTESPISSRKLQSSSNHDRVESVTVQKTSQSFLPSKIRSIFHLQRRKRYSYSVSPRSFLSSLKKLNFSRNTEFKKKVLREDIVEDDLKEEVATRKNFTKQIPTSESNHHQREKETGEWKGSTSLLLANCSSESNKSNITVVVETNKLVKRSITVKSSTTISSPSKKPTTEKELDCCVVKSSSSNSITREASVEGEGDHEQKNCTSSSCKPHEEEQDDEENGNCSNINNNKRKNSSKKFEKLKKFLLFCKGLRKKSK